MYYFIVNPNSRSGRGRSIWNEIHQQLMLRGIDFQYCLTRYSGHAAEIASDACALGTESEPVYIIAVGGDGTIHEVLTGITDFDRYWCVRINLGIKHLLFSTPSHTYHHRQRKPKCK